MLDGIRVLDLTDERGKLASMILAGLGADVDRRRATGRHPGPRASAPFAGDDAGPRPLARALGDQPGQAQRRARPRPAPRPTGTASGPWWPPPTSSSRRAAPGLLDGAGFGVADLAALNPALVHVTMSGFGSTGPKGSWRAPDLVALAAGGQLLLSGDADRAPLRCSVPQAWAHACGDAADAALIALYERLGSGVGQHCDISVQQSVMQATQSLVLNHVFGAQLGARVGGGMRLGPLDIRLVWPCDDGTVSITFLFGASAGPFSQRLFQWIWEEGGCDEATRDLDWVMFGSMLQDGEVPLSEFDRLKDLLAAFCLDQDEAGAVRRRPDPQAAHRPGGEHRRRVRHRPLRRAGLLGPRRRAGAGPTGPPPRADREAVDGPAARARQGARPRRPHRRRPRRVDRSCRARRSPPARPAPAGEQAGPLAGLKVLDFMWSLAGPAITRVLADYGATVVRVESSSPHRDGPHPQPVLAGQDRPGGLRRLTSTPTPASSGSAST